MAELLQCVQTIGQQADDIVDRMGHRSKDWQSRAPFLYDRVRDAARDRKLQEPDELLHMAQGLSPQDTADRNVQHIQDVLDRAMLGNTDAMKDEIKRSILPTP